MNKSIETDLNGVSFIIPTWNKKDMVITCIKLLDKYLSIECPKIPKEIIVIENNSNDGSYEALLKLKTKISLNILKQKTNLGFAKAVNLANKKAKYNYLYLINNDMEVQSGFFKNIIDLVNDLLGKKINFFGISSQIFFFDSTIKRVESGKTYTDFKNGKLLVGHELNSQKLKNTSLTAYCGGGSSLINKSIFNLLSGFDDSVYIPMYCEDLDLGFIAWEKGYPSFFCPNSHIIHHHRSSSKFLSVSPDYYIHKNFLSFCLKNLNIFLLLQLFIFYPLYIIFKKDYWKYLVDNFKNISNIIGSRNKLHKIIDIYKDTEIIKFNDFETKSSSKYL